MTDVRLLVESSSFSFGLGCGRDVNAEIGFRRVGGDANLGQHSHGGRTRSGHQLVEWAQGKDLCFLLSYTRQACRDTWFHPKSWTGHPIDHPFCRSRDHRFWVQLRFCLKKFWAHLGRHIQTTILWRLSWRRVGFIALLPVLPAACVDQIGWL